MNRLLLLASLGLPTTAQSATSVDVQSLQAIEQSVVDFIASEYPVPDDVSIETRSLDTRLRLRICEHPLQAAWAPGSRQLGRVTVQVECPGPTPWRVHTQARVTMQGSVWTLARSVRPGDVLTTGMLVRKTVTLGADTRALAVAGVPVLSPDEWQGYAFAQRVNAGSVLTERMLKRANLVSKGDKVVIRHRSAGLQLQTRGIALESGAANERLQVRNSNSGKVVDAIVAAPGLVDVGK